jgi:hypothetical protein
VLQKTTRSDVTTDFSGVINRNDFVFTRRVDGQTKKLYYATIEVSVAMMGNYSFTGHSVIGMDGYLYEGEFVAYNVHQNLITSDVNNQREEPFSITAVLQAGHRYDLIVMPRAPETIGAFSIVSSGPTRVNLNSRNDTITMHMRSNCEYPFDCSSFC